MSNVGTWGDGGPRLNVEDAVQSPTPPRRTVILPRSSVWLFGEIVVDYKTLRGDGGERDFDWQQVRKKPRPITFKAQKAIGSTPIFKMRVGVHYHCCYLQYIITAHLLGRWLR